MGLWIIKYKFVHICYLANNPQTRCPAASGTRYQMTLTLITGPIVLPPHQHPRGKSNLKKSSISPFLTQIPASTISLLSQSRLDLLPISITFSSVGLRPRRAWRLYVRSASEYRVLAPLVFSYWYKENFRKKPIDQLNYIYSSKTAGGNLRKHLEKNHSAELDKATKQMGWKVRLPQNKKNDDSTPGVGRKPFSPAAFMEYIVNFIVSDDQVCVCTFLTCGTLMCFIP
jgi:hypothetical protein